MKPTREEVQAAISRLHPAHPADSSVLLEQAAVNHEKLTNDPHWDIFLQELQAIMDASGLELEKYQADLGSPELVDPLEIQRVRNRIFILTERIGTLDRVINLPKEIIVSAHLPE